MNRSVKTALRALAVAALALGLSAGAWADEALEYDEADIFFELNNTDGDLGIHALIDGDAWRRLQIRDPNGRSLLRVATRGRLTHQGLTEIFFESAEPTFDELLPEEFFHRFPEGEYTILGRTLDGEEIFSESEITHLMPAPPENITVSGVDAAEDCDVEPLPAVSTPVVISWDPVTMSHPDLGRTGEPIEVTNYQVVVEREEPELLLLSVELPPGATSFEVPEDFTDLDSGDGFKFEILVREESGNQTAVESCFELL